MDTPLLTLHRQPNYRLISWSIERLEKLSCCESFFWFWKIENRHVKKGTHQKKKGKKKKKSEKRSYTNNNNKNQRLFAVKTNGSPQLAAGGLLLRMRGNSLLVRKFNTKVTKHKTYTSLWLFRPRHHFLKVYGSLSKILTTLTFNWILSNLLSAIKDFNHAGH